MLELVATLSALCAEYLKTREERHERVDADAFRQWLHDDVFPRLLEQSAQALESITGLKAAEKELACDPRDGGGNNYRRAVASVAEGRSDRPCWLVRDVPGRS
jgi:hypothetical protein